MMTVNIP
nr:unnamed protein product [Callosobruchus chinensis]